MSSGEMSFREKCLIGRNVLGRNVLGRTVQGRNGFWGEMSYIPKFSILFNRVLDLTRNRFVVGTLKGILSLNVASILSFDLLRVKGRTETL